MIEVSQLSGGEILSFRVVIRDTDGHTQHEVTLRESSWQRLGGGAGATDFVDAVFRFLLDREPKEAILGRFDVSVIPRYFPDFEQRIADYLRA